jgi:hypothetical protein
VQPEAFADDQVIVDPRPRSMEFVLSTRVGAAGTTSVKVTVLEAEVMGLEPLGTLLQVSV